MIIDGPTFIREELETAFASLLPALKFPDYQRALTQLAEQAVFLPTDEPAIRERVIRDLTARPRHVVASSWKYFLAYPVERAIAVCRVPVLFIKSHFPSNPDRVRELCPRVMVGQTAALATSARLSCPSR